jgi:hypothetical protein
MTNSEYFIDQSDCKSMYYIEEMIHPMQQKFMNGSNQVIRKHVLLILEVSIFGGKSSSLEIGEHKIEIKISNTQITYVIIFYWFSLHIYIP